MKIDRLLGITVFLLNHGRVSASILAERFEVSKRTIQRDIEDINRAGIPVLSSLGAEGGYEILDTFKMERQAACDSDYSFILTALRGLSSAYNHPKFEAVLEKILSVSGNSVKPSNIYLDFGVLHEINDTNELLSLLDSAISAKRAVSFDYVNAEGAARNHEVEPIALTYKWYSWYLFAFSNNSKDYRLYKLVRMARAKITNQPFLQKHESADILLKERDEKDSRKHIDIRLRCNAEIKMLATEYLKGEIEKEFENGDFILSLHLPENEHFWFGSLLAFGNKAEVLKPESLKKRLCSKAKEILDAYHE
jgi:predicted DNA-binding transcriptional regulator YafY